MQSLLEVVTAYHVLGRELNAGPQRRGSCCTVAERVHVLVHKYLQFVSDKTQAVHYLYIYSS